MSLRLPLPLLIPLAALLALGVMFLGSWWNGRRLLNSPPVVLLQHR